METKAAVAWEAGKPLSIETVNLDGPKEGEVLVEVKATGICHTDEFTRSGADPEGLFPAILGHEGADVVVEVGGVKLQLAPTALQLKEAPEAPRDRTMAYSGPAADVRPEVHLRGLTSEEALLELIRALDAAVQAGLPQLRVVHGKGTGVLRAAVAEFVQHDRRVRAHRLGAPHEGGSGVTVLELE